MPYDSEFDPSVPGGVYLCQVSQKISCGACCGLYNVADASFESLMSMLSGRTERFTDVVREADAISEFGRRNEALVSGERPQPYPKFHHCPFIGLVGRYRSRVGCLLHPLAAGNNGIDFRGLSYYGGMACRVYFCPSHRQLGVEVKKCVREIAQNWYEYGLIITESRLLSAIFDIAAKLTGAPVTADHIFGNNTRTDAVRELLRLKIDWPFRPSPDPGPCNYFFEDHLYPKPTVKYTGSSKTSSRYDAIFRELVSSFNSRSELQYAEQLVNKLVNKLAAETE